MADLREGRITLPIILLLPRLDRHTRESLAEVATSGRFEAISETTVLEMVRTSGVLEEVRLRANQFSEKAIQQTESLPKGPERDALIRASELLLDRGV
jgi:octaprenyl-diphosphate synthase